MPEGWHRTRLGLNVRRHLSKGQKAAALAFMYPEPERGRGKKDPAKKHADSASFSFRRLQVARRVLEFSPELAESVFVGVTPLDQRSTSLLTPVNTKVYY
jgi:hypothetical protein